jgi:hypothetical protein
MRSRSVKKYRPAKDMPLGKIVTVMETCNNHLENERVFLTDVAGSNPDHGKALPTKQFEFHETAAIFPELPGFLDRRQTVGAANAQPRHRIQRSHTVTATVLPFPVVRRRGFIAKQVAHASLMNSDSGVRYLQHQLKLQADAMRRRGIDEDLVQRELRCLVSAIRADFAHNVADNLGGEA